MGVPVNGSGKLYNVVHYRVRQDDQRLDYDHIAEQAAAHKPKLMACASAYPRTIDFARFPEIADSVGVVDGGCGARCGVGGDAATP